jgi:CheY-like chemotaxis protein
MNHRNLRILVADDQENTRAIFSRVLNSLGYTCDACSDGKECLEKFLGRSYDVVFLDLVMPGIDGEPVLRWLRSRFPSTHVIITSVQDDEGAIRTMLARGATAYIVKPFTAHEVESVMRGIENRRTATDLTLAAVGL